MKQELQTDQAGEKQWGAAERTMADFKRLASRYASAAWDARQPGIRALYRQLLQQTLDDQDKLYRLLADRGDKKKVQNASGEDVLQEIASHDRALSELEAAIRKDFAGIEAKEAETGASPEAVLYTAEADKTTALEPVTYEEKELEIFGERPDYYSSLSSSSVYDSSYGDVYHPEPSVSEEEESVSAEAAETGLSALAAPEQPAPAPAASAAPAPMAPSRFGGAPASAAPEQPAPAPAASAAQPYAAPRSPYGGSPATGGAVPYGTPAAAAPPVAYASGGPGPSYGGFRSPAPASAREPYGQSRPQPGQPAPGAYSAGQPQRYGQSYARQPQQSSPTPITPPSAQQPYNSPYRGEGGGRPPAYRPLG
ncbi:spore coat protein [Paenibacillus sp. HGF7]|uniref:spore coat protein n=1 Tax=Paenibacillus sp. HGF7 TaxID=944559 RepID=UPI00020D774D|nr:spore coat protein [Paenibacillus sp. HGF7]EGL17418.1 translation initiation factor IF-2 domain protein [Paenibacillus sp. HGF7]